MRKTTTVALLSLAVAGCGMSVESAREDLTIKGCNFYQQCMQIGSGKTYATYDDCKTQLRAYWLSALPSADCSKGIDGSKYQVCTSGIAGAQCGNALDFLSVLQKCSKQQLCLTQ